MTPTEMLKFCLEAFEAMQTSARSKGFMRRHSIKPPNAVNASHSLTLAMQQRLREYLGEKP